MFLSLVWKKTNVKVAMAHHILSKAVKGLSLAFTCLLMTGLLNAQLNQNCTVSILNRTTQAQPDGSWTISNVPAGFGTVRARATCVNNGITQFGQSDLFQIAPNQVNGFNATIKLGVTTPIPTAL